MSSHNTERAFITLGYYLPCSFSITLERNPCSCSRSGGGMPKRASKRRSGIPCNELDILCRIDNISRGNFNFLNMWDQVGALRATFLELSRSGDSLLCALGDHKNKIVAIAFATRLNWPQLGQHSNLAMRGSKMTLPGGDSSDTKLQRQRGPCSVIEFRLDTSRSAEGYRQQSPGIGTPEVGRSERPTPLLLALCMALRQSQTTIPTNTESLRRSLLTTLTTSRRLTLSHFAIGRRRISRRPTRSSR